jgi:class 3 adenylate cyclase
MNVAEQLRAAAQYIREHGWTRRGFGLHGGPRCMIGAIGSVLGIDPQRVSVPVPVVLYGVCGDCSDKQGLVAFNDHDCKTKNDAIAALEIAADLAS